jgi:hypothetical protein
MNLFFRRTCVIPGLGSYGSLASALHQALRTPRYKSGGCLAPGGHYEL